MENTGIQIGNIVIDGTKGWLISGDTFATDRDVPTMVEKLTELLKNYKQASSVVEDDRFFGDNGQAQVALLSLSCVCL